MADGQLSKQHLEHPAPCHSCRLLATARVDAITWHPEAIKQSNEPAPAGSPCGKAAIGVSLVILFSYVAATTDGQLHQVHMLAGAVVAVPLASVLSQA